MTQREHVQDNSYIIPYQELLGNYDVTSSLGVDSVDYTIPRAIREL